jgi:hypothetical protein
MTKYFVTILLVAVFAQIVLAQNPILPIGTYIADPSARVWDDGRLYIYGSRDESTAYYCSYDHYVVSTDDLINWKITKDAFVSKGDNDQVAYNDALLFAPDCIEKDGKYYLYYCQPYRPNPTSNAMSRHAEGVAVSNHPEGPFIDGKAIDLKGHNQIDPGIFIDDDGQVYYLWGQFNLKMAKMNDDMCSIDESTLNANVLSESEHHFHEGAFMIKRKGIYYLVFADISRAGRPNSLGYATSKTPFGPYKYGGVIIDNDHCDPASWNNHGSIVEFKNQWYIFYHRSTHGGENMRRMCMEPISFNVDGSIPEVEMTSQGAGAPLNAFDNIEVERACLLYGNARFQLWNPTNEKLTLIKNRDRAAYKYIDFKKGEANKVEFVVSPGLSPGKILVNIGKSWHQNIAVISIPAKKGDEEWITVSADLKEVTGVHELWLTFQGSNEGMYSIDKFTFKK